MRTIFQDQAIALGMKIGELVHEIFDIQIKKRSHALHIIVR